MAFMKENRQNLTAQRVALKRAAHKLLDDPKVLDDPLAIHIIGQESAVALQSDPHKFEAHPLSPYLRAFVVARSRYAEDELDAGYRHGVAQYVILGAGLDTFAYRNTYLGGRLHIFEVDHPSTQIWKRARLEEIGIKLPKNLTFVPVDFETQTLSEELMSSGYDPDKCTFFSWLGVTEYLKTDAVMATLHYIASIPAGSGVVFDYILSPALLSSEQRSRFDAIANRVASAGEPWQTFFDPPLLTEDLRAMGFRHIEDNRPEEINSRYFKDRKDGLRVGSLSHIMKAKI
jgi:methyltransferase (TIGR00027 family)